jgi:hypothetical protein
MEEASNGEDTTLCEDKLLHIHRHVVDDLTTGMALSSST